LVRGEKPGWCLARDRIDQKPLSLLVQKTGGLVFGQRAEIVGRRLRAYVKKFDRRRIDDFLKYTNNIPRTQGRFGKGGFHKTAAGAFAVLDSQRAAGWSDIWNYDSLGRDRNLQSGGTMAVGQVA